MSPGTQARRDKPQPGAAWAASRSREPEAWLLRFMPRTSDALGHFTFHHELVYLRNELQTSTYEGGDINTASYSTAARGFGAATVTYFEKLSQLGSAREANSMLPEVARVRRAFLRMTEVAEDPNARARLIRENQAQPSQLAQIQRKLAAVDESLIWAWARCEYLFRMATIESLSLGS